MQQQNKSFPLYTPQCYGVEQVMIRLKLLRVEAVTEFAYFVYLGTVTGDLDYVYEYVTKELEDNLYAMQKRPKPA